MTRRRKLLITGATILVLGAGGAGIAQAVSGDQGGATGDREESGEQESRKEKTVGGSTASRAAAAAIKAVGGGTATEVEKDGNRGYEVEVKRSDGRFADVKLDPALHVVSVNNED